MARESLVQDNVYFEPGIIFISRPTEVFQLRFFLFMENFMMILKRDYEALEQSKITIERSLEERQEAINKLDEFHAHLAPHMIEDLKALLMCPIVVWTARFVNSMQEKGDNKLAQKMSKYENIKLLPTFLHLVVGGHYFTDAFSLSFYAHIFSSNLIDSVENTEALESDMESVLKRDKTAAMLAIPFLMKGYRDNSIKSTDLLEKAVVSIMDGEGVGNFISSCTIEGHNELAMTGRILSARKSITVSFQNDNIVESAVFSDEDQKTFRLGMLAPKLELLDMMRALIKEGKMIASPQTGYLFISSTATESDVAYISKLHKVAMCNNTPIFRVALTEAEYEAANEDLRAFAPLVGDLSVRFHQSFVDALQEVTYDVSAYYFLCASRLTDEKAKLCPKAFVEALDEDGDMRFHFNRILLDTIDPVLNDVTEENALNSLIVSSKGIIGKMVIQTIGTKTSAIQIPDGLTKDEYKRMMKSLRSTRVYVAENGVRSETFSTLHQPVSISILFEDGLGELGWSAPVIETKFGQISKGDDDESFFNILPCSVDCQADNNNSELLSKLSNEYLSEKHAEYINSNLKKMLTQRDFNRLIDSLIRKKVLPLSVNSPFAGSGKLRSAIETFYARARELGLRVAGHYLCSPTATNS